MPTLHWIGKDKVVNHHQDVPFRVMEHKYGFADGKESKKETGSGNKIIHGDNLEALKTLLPEYEGRIKCIYIDPPYNTGNESWVYNDNVNDPRIKKWLGEVVGKEGEDLSRHDKWLCMMYPRLKLLHKLLADDGLIFISIDDNEYQNIKYLCDEIFGRRNFITNFTWKTDGNFDNQAKIKINHEYILCYAKVFESFKHPRVVDPNIADTSKLFKSEIRNTVVKNGPKNPVSEIFLPKGFPADFEKGTIKSRIDAWPHYDYDAIIENYELKNDVVIRSGWSSKKILEDFIKNSFKEVQDTKEQLTSFVITKTGAVENIKKREEASHVVSSLQSMGSTQSMSTELKKMGINFDYPKPNRLLEYFVSILPDKDSLVLDSFSGSGTTAHAVLNLNKEDGGNRKYILIEMEDYAETITAERVKRVINGYGDVPGTGGSFDYYTLGEPLFDEDKNINENLPVEKIRQYVYYTETGSPLGNEKHGDNEFFLSLHEGAAYYFYYKKGETTALDYDFLRTIKTKAEMYVIYADNCLLPGEFMKEKNIFFKKIPRDIARV